MASDDQHRTTSGGGAAPRPTNLPAAVQEARAREARLAKQVAAQHASVKAAQEAVARELVAELDPAWAGSLQSHRSRWLTSLGEQQSPTDAPQATGAPLSTFSLDLLFGKSV